MAHLAGKGGFVKKDAVEYKGVTSWTLDYVVDPLEVTNFEDDGVREYVIGVRGWSGSFTSRKDEAPDPNTTFGTEINIKLGESDTGSQLWTGKAIITGIHATTSFDGIVEYTFDFQGSEGLTVAGA